MTYYTRDFNKDPGDTARESDLETEFDSIATGFAAVADDTDNAIRFTNADFSAQTSSANAATRANKVLGFDSSGDLELKTGYATAVTAAEAAQAAAEASETAAAASEAAAAASEAAAGASETAAIAAQGYAEEWASKAEDSLVSVAAGGNGSTEYSALHWAAKASASATAAASAAEGSFTVVTAADSPITMATSGKYFFVLSGGAIAATLPSVGAGDHGKSISWVVDGNAATNNLTITPSDADTVAGESSVEVDVAYASGVMVYDDGNTNWSI